MSDNKEVKKTPVAPAVKEVPKKKEIHRRTTDEIVAAIQKKIDYHTACIASLEKKKAAALMPSKGKQVKEAIQTALASGMTMEEIAARLNSVNAGSVAATQNQPNP